MVDRIGRRMAADLSLGDVLAVRERCHGCHPTGAPTPHRGYVCQRCGRFNIRLYRRDDADRRWLTRAQIAAELAAAGLPVPDDLARARPGRRVAS